MAEMSHPRGLYVLFSAEAWERFSFYGMRALLVLYMVNYLKFERTDALAVYAMYTGLVYFTPFIGGYLADTVLGARKAILVGGLVMALGHLAMAFESLLYIALGLLIVGNGFFKPNISTLVGSLYERDDPRRDGGFTIFYMGINLGAFFSPLVCGTLGEKLGWHYGFSAAAFGMLCGLGAFLWGQKLLGTAGFPPGREVTPDSRLNSRDWRDVVLLVLGSVVLVVAMIKGWERFGYLWRNMGPYAQAACGLCVAILINDLRRWFNKGRPEVAGEEPLTMEEYKRIAVICILAVFVVFFWMGFEQAGGTMTLFADQQTDRHLLGYEIPASYFQSINPLGIILLAPFLSMFWGWMNRSKYAISTPAKMGWALILLGISFIIMYTGQQIAEQHGTVGPWWLAAVYLVQTVGELFLSPIGLSMVTKLAPLRLASLLMGVWFIANAVANYLAGRLEELVSVYHWPVYRVLVATSLGAGLLLLLMTPLLKRWMGGRG